MVAGVHTSVINICKEIEIFLKISKHVKLQIVPIFSGNMIIIIKANRLCKRWNNLKKIFILLLY